MSLLFRRIVSPDRRLGGQEGVEGDRQLLHHLLVLVQLLEVLYIIKHNAICMCIYIYIYIHIVSYNNCYYK